MKRAYQITSVVLLALAGFVGMESLTLRLYTKLGPGPGFFPLCLSILLAVLAGSMFFQSRSEKPGPLPNGFLPDRPALAKMAAVALAIVGVSLLLEPVGFCLTMLGFYLFLLSVLDRQKWFVTLSLALAGSFGMYSLFTHWLASPLPAGLLAI